MDIFLGTLETDLEQPTIENRSPVPGSRNASIDTAVAFDVLDVGGSGVSAASLTVWFNADLVYDADGGGFQVGYAGAVTSILNGYHFTATRTGGFPLDFFAHVRVLVQDSAVPPNVTDNTWVFRTRDPDVAADQRRLSFSADVMVLVGHFKGSTVFGPGEARESTLVSDGAEDGFAAGFLLTTGNLRWVKRAGGTDRDSLVDVSVFA